MPRENGTGATGGSEGDPATLYVRIEGAGILARDDADAEPGVLFVGEEHPASHRMGEVRAALQAEGLRLLACRATAESAP